MDKKKTVVIGATPNPSRYAFMAANMLKEYGHKIIPVGIKRGEVAGEEIIDLKELPSFEEVDTVTLYVGSRNIPEWINYIIGLHPRRIIFNPGTENTELAEKARENNIEVVFGCTLVMLRSNSY